MNFHIYVEDSIGEKLNNLSFKTGKKRNTLVREALERYVNEQYNGKRADAKSRESALISALAGSLAGAPTLESHRGELLPLADDPFAERM